MNDILHITALSKHFAEVKAVDDLSFAVRSGEVYGFLGQNGAGKSTTIRMLLTLINPTKGSIYIFGKDIRHHRKEILQQVGAIIEKPDLYNYLTALDNLQMMAKLSGKYLSTQQLVKQLEIVGIADRARSKVKTFSQGMKQRLGIACALIHDPKLVILDEPTNGLDPQGIADIRNLILQLSRDEGKTVFVSSHLLSEIELIADSMLIIDKGKKVADGKVADLLHPAGTEVEIITTDDEAARKIFALSPWAESLHQGRRLVFTIHKDRIPEIARFCVAQNMGIISLQPRNSLEDFFLSLTTANQHVATYKD